MKTADELLKRALDEICGARLCSINSMSSRDEMMRLMGSAIDSIKAYLDAPKPEPKKPMTDEEINKILMEQKGNLNAAWFLVFARAIERHHGIGEKE